MSYDRITPAYYKTFQPDTPYHAGARGWTEAPWPTWGDNPNLAGKRLLATDGLAGLGSVTAISGLGSPDGLGAYFQTTYKQPISPGGAGTSTVARYAPIDGAPSCAPCAAKAQSGFGSPDGLGAYFQTMFKQPISPIGGGTSTVAHYSPISGWAAKQTAQAGVRGFGDVGGAGLSLGAMIAAGVVGYGIWHFFLKKPKKMARNGRRFRRNERWSRKYKNRLPDSAFLYVEPGGMTHIDGGRKVTSPKSLRHFPVKNAAGSVDLPHVRSALSRIGRSKVPSSVKPKLQAKASRLLAEHGGYRRRAGGGLRRAA